LRYHQRVLRLACTSLFIASLAVTGACDKGSDAEENSNSADSEADNEAESAAAEEDTGDCPTGQTICDGECTDLTSDPDHCGSCGFACVEGGTCEEALCIADCSGGELSCDGMCTDVSSNDLHCGDCDSPCQPGLHCEGGSCACGDPVSFATDVLPLLSDGCNGEECHDAVEPDADLDLETDVYAALVDAAATQCNSAVRVSGGSVDGSYLMNKLLGEDMCQGQQMPRNEPPLPDEDIAKIANWICHGAAND
jgi:hypothetical protein